MDKIKPALQWLIRNRFWVTCGLVSVISLATWYLAWSSIEKQRSDRARTLTQKKSSVEGVISSTIPTGVGEEELRVHPNDGTQSGMEQRIKLAGEGALAAWKARYDKQQAMLQISEVLPEQLRRPLIAHDPMEKPMESELLTETQRYTFTQRITKQMPLIAEAIQTQWQFDEKGVQIEDTQADSRRPDRNEGLRVSKDLVRWELSNQELWNSKTTEFAGFNGNDDAQNRPTTKQVLALQQDLWILEGIFDAIAEVNQGFTANDLAPVERVDHILVGNDAINPELGTLIEYSYVPPSSANATSSGKKKGGGVKSKKQKRKESLGRRKAKSKGKASPFNPGESRSPFHGRYVDRDFTQLNESAITKAITSEKLTDQSYLAVAKRVPVRIAVKMDERRINDFLAAAANSPFAFEIRQVRINKHTPGEGVERKAEGVNTKKKGDERGKLGLGGGTQGGNQADSGGSRRRGGSAKDDLPFQSEIRTNFDVKIEFIGIVKIYNPVNRALIFPNEKTDAKKQ